MRCKNCGWPNKPEEKFCVKCHSPLEAAADVVPPVPAADVVPPVPGAGGGAVPPAPPVPPVAGGQQTVREEDVFGPAGGGGAAAPGGEGQKCPRCGYPLRSGAEKCPHCNYQLSGQPVSEYRQPRFADERPAAPRQPTRPLGGGKFGGTVNPYMQDVLSEPGFVLKPVKRQNERHELEEREYEGESVTLNRANTEEGNPSITSRQQAVVSRVDGRWYIEDTSEQRTTFVQAARRTELHDGDLILLGNRLFEFHE